jgi:ABC-2 type transport system permease protein
MRGGSVVVAASNYGLAFDNFTQGFALYPVNNGIAPLLAHYGVNLADGVVMDAQNSPFPVVTVRSVQGTAVQEVQAADYPFFVDVRQNSMSDESVITGNIPAVTLSYASPVELDPNLNAARETEVLLSSSSNAWLRLNGDITPNFELYPETGFAVGNSLTQYPLAVSVQGQFESYFKDRELPGQTAATEPATVDELLESSGTPAPDDDPAVAGDGAAGGDRQLVFHGRFGDGPDLCFPGGSGAEQPAAAAKRGRLGGRGPRSALDSRAQFASVRVLNPLTEDEQRIYELANYIFALLALVGIFVVWRLRRQTAPLLAG